MTPETRNLLALSLVSGIGPRFTQILLERFGSAGRVLSATAAELEAVPRIGATTANQFAEALRRTPVDAEIAEMDRHGVELVTLDCPDYPQRLKTISDCPQLLYRKGRISLTDGRAVGIVGSRDCTAYGKAMAERIAGGLARAGYTVVSGLARGIDGYAHEAALAAGGRTIAVLAGGLSKIYPPEHAGLAERIAGNGYLLSETAMRLDPQRGMFHSRNRLISGLSTAVVIIEANARSGALITARHAAEQDRPVLVIPANADSPTSAGSLRLIRDGARLVRGVDDILEDLRGLATGAEKDLFSELPDRTKAEGSKADAVTAPVIPVGPPPGLDGDALAVWEYLSEERHFDDIAASTGRPIPQLTTLLMQLEMKRAIRRLPGNVYRRI